MNQYYLVEGVLHSATEDNTSNLRGQLQSLASKATYNHNTREQKQLPGPDINYRILEMIVFKQNRCQSQMFLDAILFILSETA